MTPTEVGSLLKRISAYDGRRPDEPGTIAVWLDAAQRGRWTLPEAAEAVSEFFNLPRDPNSPRRWLEPGHITHMIRSRRGRVAPVAEVLALRQGGTGSSGEHRARMRQLVAEKLAAQGARPAIEARAPWHNGPIARDTDEPDVAEGTARARALLAGGDRRRPTEPSQAFSAPQPRR